MSSDESSETSDENTDQPEEYISSDIITDLKTGIYNLFLSLINHLIVTHGPTEAVIISTEFLDNISNKFKETIN